jgi:hypothetical protein
MEKLNQPQCPGILQQLYGVVGIEFDIQFLAVSTDGIYTQVHLIG